MLTKCIHRTQSIHIYVVSDACIMCTKPIYRTMAPFVVPSNRANPTLQSRSALLSSPYSNTNNAEKAHPPIGVNPLLQPSVPLVPGSMHMREHKAITDNTDT
eukprot:1047221_1